LTDYLPSVDGGEERKAGAASALHTKSNANRHIGFDLDRGVAYLIRNFIMVCAPSCVKMLIHLSVLDGEILLKTVATPGSVTIRKSD